MEHIIASDLPIKVLYNVTNLLTFYHQTFLQVILKGVGVGLGEPNGFKIVHFIE